MALNKIRYLEKAIMSSWWTILFILVCYLCYEEGIKKRDQDYSKLHAQFLELQKEKEIASAKQQDLLLQINSQSDPDWVELTLMKGLGLVPEGQIKVFFTDQAKEINY